MKSIKIVGILIKDRIKEAGKTQRILSEYSHIIQNRLGFHEVTEAVCSRIGIIILTLRGNPEEWQNFEKELSKIGGIEVKSMSFEY